MTKKTVDEIVAEVKALQTSEEIKAALMESTKAVMVAVYEAESGKKYARSINSKTKEALAASLAQNILQERADAAFLTVPAEVKCAPEANEETHTSDCAAGKLVRIDRLEGEKYLTALQVNKKLVESCATEEELVGLFMTGTKKSMHQAAVSCGMPSCYGVKDCTKEGAAKRCAVSVLQAREIARFKALKPEEKLEAMICADSADRYSYVHSLTVSELREYASQLYAGREDEVKHFCKYQGEHFGLVQLLSRKLNEYEAERARASALTSEADEEQPAIASTSNTTAELIEKPMVLSLSKPRIKPAVFEIGKSLHSN